MQHSWLLYRAEPLCIARVTVPLPRGQWYYEFWFCHNLILGESLMKEKASLVIMWDSWWLDRLLRVGECFTVQSMVYLAVWRQQHRETLKYRSWGSSPAWQNHSLCFNRVPRWSVCKLESGKHYCNENHSLAVRLWIWFFPSLYQTTWDNQLIKRKNWAARWLTR